MMNKLVIVAVLGLNVGCASVTPNYDEKFGDAVREARLKMTINPEAGKNPDQVTGQDGKAAANAQTRYQDSFKKPPPVVPVINIGGSLSTSGGGN